MTPLSINETEFSPKVILNPESNQFIISGESRPENAGKFYTPVLEWLDEYAAILKSHPKEIIFEFKFNYFNTISAKYTLRILEKLNGLTDGNQVTVIWYYNKRDADMKESGNEFSKLVPLPFNFVEY